MRSKLSLFWKCQIAGWVAFVVLTLPIKLIISDSLVAALGAFVVRDGFSFALTLGMRAIYDKIYQNHKEPGWITGAIAIVSVTAGMLQLPVFFLLGDIFPFEEKTLFSKSVGLGIFYYRTGLFVCWSLLYFGIRQALDGMERDLQLALIESERRNAQLQMLRAQMNPHFLFNALNTIQAEIGKPEVPLKPTVRALTEYLRFSLDHGDDEFIPLGLEYEAMTAYLKVERLRFREDLVFESHIDETARGVPVPGICQRSLQNAPPVVTSKCTTFGRGDLGHFWLGRQGFVGAAGN
jgi:hypothetical protein